MTRKVEIYDTTLRDGAQTEGISFSLSDKIRIARLVDGLGVAYIEGGYPGSNQKENQFFDQARELEGACLVAFGMTCRKGLRPEEDKNIRSLVSADTREIALVGKSSKFQVEKVLSIGLKENIRIIEESCAFLTQLGKRVIYDAEHFFDGFKEDLNYSLETLRAAVRGGAELLVLCDTNGGSLPKEVGEIIQMVQREVGFPLGIHAHNDSGFAVANTIWAVENGATQVQGTINGYGERCGNADLCTVIPVLQLKMGFDCLPVGKLKSLTGVSRQVAEIANLKPDLQQPFVGESAFTHKGGIHIAGLNKNSVSYQHIDPETVGNISRTVVSELSGKGSISVKSEELGIVLSPSEIRKVLEQIKEKEAKGFQFEIAEASLELLMRKARQDYSLPFEVTSYSVTVGNHCTTGNQSVAVVELKVKGKMIEEEAEGNGPVNALDKAIKKALFLFYPELSRIRLVDYKVRVINGKKGTGSSVRILTEFSNGLQTWITVSASVNIIKASLEAIADGLEYALLQSRNFC